MQFPQTPANSPTAKEDTSSASRSSTLPEIESQRQNSVEAQKDLQEIWKEMDTEEQIIATDWASAIGIPTLEEVERRTTPIQAHR